MKIASKTLELFEYSVAKDGGSSYRKYLGQVLPHISDAYREDDDPFRNHLGASTIGGECDRAIWYSFRWFFRSTFSGTILRLFNRGHLEEGRFIALLLASGIQVFQQDVEGRQYRISAYGGHFGGSGDGVALGIPDIPEGEYCLLEFKTHNDASFKKLQKAGVKKEKSEHYTQMQMYMNDMSLNYGIYLAVNKNDDKIHAEIIVRDNYTAPQFLERAGKIIFSTHAPARISDIPSWYLCKWCDAHAICHKAGIPEVNCRTCVYSTPQQNGDWLCRLHNSTLSKKNQLDGCDHYMRFE